jgi:hypothetical protein
MRHGRGKHPLASTQLPSAPGQDNNQSGRRIIECDALVVLVRSFGAVLVERANIAAWRAKATEANTI